MILDILYPFIVIVAIILWGAVIQWMIYGYKKKNYDGDSE